jgi:hypothetical protein
MPSSRCRLRQSYRNVDILPKHLDFCSMFSISTRPSTLDISAPFVISGDCIYIKKDEVVGFKIKPLAPPFLFFSF